MCPQQGYTSPTADPDCAWEAKYQAGVRKWGQAENAGIQVKCKWNARRRSEGCVRQSSVTHPSLTPCTAGRHAGAGRRKGTAQLWPLSSHDATGQCQSYSCWHSHGGELVMSSQSCAAVYQDLLYHPAAHHWRVPSPSIPLAFPSGPRAG